MTSLESFNTSGSSSTIRIGQLVLNICYLLRKGDVDGGAKPGLRGEGDLALENSRHDVAHDRQTESRGAAISTGREERFEDLVEVLGSDACAVVAHGEGEGGHGLRGAGR